MSAPANTISNKIETGTYIIPRPAYYLKLEVLRMFLSCPIFTVCISITKVKKKKKNTIKMV